MYDIKTKDTSQSNGVNESKDDIDDGEEEIKFSHPSNRSDISDTTKDSDNKTK
jgi:hypothetical protein